MKSPYQLHLKKMKNNNQKFNLKKEVKKDVSQKTPRASSATAEQKMVVQRAKAGIPVQSILGTIFLVVGGWYGYEHAESLESYLSKVEIGFFGTAGAEASSAPSAKTGDAKPQNPAKDSSEKSQARKMDVATASSLTPEELALFKSLEERKNQLDSREADLKKLEEELHKQRVELDAKLSQLDQLRGQIGNQLEEKVKVDGEQVDKLVAFYMNMKPQRAAEVIETLNEDLAVEVLRKMKKKEAAEIMNAIKPEKAQRLSERFAGYRK